MIDPLKSYRAAAFAWIGLALFPLHVRAASAKLERLGVVPEAIELSTARDRQSIVVQAEYADGSTRDVTAEASVLRSSPLSRACRVGSLPPPATARGGSR